MGTISVKIWLYIKICPRHKNGEGRLDWKVDIKKNNDNTVFIKDNWICSIQKVVIEGSEVDILEKIKKARSKNEEVVRVVEEIKKTGVKMLWGDEWQIEGDLVLKKGKVYVPKNGELKAEIIQLHHDVSVAEVDRKQQSWSQGIIGGQE